MGLEVTCIGGARVEVVTMGGDFAAWRNRHVLAGAGDADVIGADAAVVGALAAVEGLMLARIHGIAQILGAQVAVVTRQGLAPRLTVAIGADIAQRTDIAIETGFAVGRVDAAGVRLAGIVGAGIPVFTVQRHAGQALPFEADVPDRALVTIFAGTLHGLEQALSCGTTGIPCAVVPVVTAQGLAHADPAVATVALGTGTAVRALTTGDRLGGASLCAQAEVLGAGVAVVAALLVHAGIAVVVDPVAKLRGGNGSIARGQPVGAADSLPGTGAVLVGNLARRPERQGHRLGRAGAGAGGGDALGSGHAVNGRGVLAGESCRTIAVLLAASAAEAPPLPIVYADVVHAPGALTVVARGAGSAEVGMEGDAHRDHITSGSPHRLADPARGAVLDAHLAAHTVTDVLHAPVGLALGVIGARVEEAALSRRTFVGWLHTISDLPGPDFGRGERLLPNETGIGHEDDLGARAD